MTFHGNYYAYCFNSLGKIKGLYFRNYHHIFIMFLVITSCSVAGESEKLFFSFNSKINSTHINPDFNNYNAVISQFDNNLREECPNFIWHCDFIIPDSLANNLFSFSRGYTIYYFLLSDLVYVDYIESFTYSYDTSNGIKYASPNVKINSYNQYNSIFQIISNNPSLFSSNYKPPKSIELSPSNFNLLTKTKIIKQFESIINKLNENLSDVTGKNEFIANKHTKIVKHFDKTYPYDGSVNEKMSVLTANFSIIQNLVNDTLSIIRFEPTNNSEFSSTAFLNVSFKEMDFYFTDFFSCSVTNVVSLPDSYYITFKIHTDWRIYKNDILKCDKNGVRRIFPIE